MSPPPPADPSDAADEAALPSVLRGQEPTPIPKAVEPAASEDLPRRPSDPSARTASPSKPTPAPETKPAPPVGTKPTPRKDPRADDDLPAARSKDSRSDDAVPARKDPRSDQPTARKDPRSDDDLPAAREEAVRKDTPRKDAAATEVPLARVSNRGAIALANANAAVETLQNAPKKETLKLFPYSGNMGAAVPTPMPPAPEPPKRETPHATPKARPAIAERQARSKGPQPKDPAAVHATLEPLLAWMPEDQRPEVTKQLLCGEYDGVLRILSEHRQRYPRNLTISKAIEVVEDAAASRLLHELGPLNSEIIVVGAESGRGNIGALLRLARQAATLGELLEKTPLGRVRTLQLVAQLVKEGTLAVRMVAKPTGFGAGAFSTPSMETVKRRMSQEMPAVLSSFAEVKAAADGPAPTEESEADALFAQLERATLPDPTEVAASLQKLRDRNLTPAVRPRMPSEVFKRFDDRVDDEGGVRQVEESLSAEPPAVRDRASSSSALDLDAPEAARSAVPEPKPSKPDAAKPDAAKPDATKPDPKAKEPSDPPVAAAGDEPREAEDEKPARKSVVPDPAIYEELKRLRPEPIREGEDRVRSNPPLLLLAVGAIGLVAIALSLYALFGRQPADPPRTQPLPAEPKPLPTAEPTLAPTVTAPAPTSPPTQAPPSAAAVETVTLEVEVSPRYAQVYLDGTLLTKPFKQTIAKDDRKHELRIEAGGYKTQTRTFTMKGDTSFVVALEPIIGRKKEEPTDGPVYP